MIQKIHKHENATVVYQETRDDMQPISEPAIIISCGDNDDLIILSQEGRGVLINIGTLEQVIKTMRQVVRDKEANKKKSK